MSKLESALKNGTNKSKIMMRIGALLFLVTGLFLGALLAALAGVPG